MKLEINFFFIKLEIIFFNIKLEINCWDAILEEFADGMQMGVSLLGVSPLVLISSHLSLDDKVQILEAYSVLRQASK